MVYSIYVYALLTFNLICSIEAMKEFVGDSMGDAYGVEVEDKGEKLTVSLGEDESGHHEEIQAGAHNRDIALVEVTASGALKTVADDKPENQCFSCVSQGKVYCKTTRGEKCYSVAEAAANGCGGNRISPPLQYVMVSQGTVSASQPLDQVLQKGGAFNNPAEGIKFNFAACGVVKGAPPTTKFVDCSKITDECRMNECDRFCSAKNKAEVHCEQPKLGGTLKGGMGAFYCGDFPPEVQAELAKRNNTVTGAMTCKKCLENAHHAWCDDGQTGHTGIAMGTETATACYMNVNQAKQKCARAKIVVGQTPAKKRPAGC